MPVTGSELAAVTMFGIINRRRVPCVSSSGAEIDQFWYTVTETVVLYFLDHSTYDFRQTETIYAVLHVGLPLQ